MKNRISDIASNVNPISDIISDCLITTCYATALAYVTTQWCYFLVVNRVLNGPFHRWASTSISMSAISDIRHRHMLFRYRRQICRTEKRHSEIGTLPISTSEFTPMVHSIFYSMPPPPPAYLPKKGSET